MHLFRDIAHAYTQHIVHDGKEQAFWLLVAFLVTFLSVRLITHAIKSGRGPFRNVSAGGTHIHHLVPGIILVLISGYCSIALHLHAAHIPDAIAFGLGAALTIDEFALWLNLKDVYWSKQGRWSVDAAIIVIALASLVVLGPGLWRDIGRSLLKI